MLANFIKPKPYIEKFNLLVTIILYKKPQFSKKNCQNNLSLCQKNFVLAILLHNETQLSFTDYMSCPLVRRLNVQYPKTPDFVNYIKSFWFSIIGPKTWNVFSRPHKLRTTKKLQNLVLVVFSRCRNGTSFYLQLFIWELNIIQVFCQNLKTIKTKNRCLHNYYCCSKNYKNSGYFQTITNYQRTPCRRCSMDLVLGLELISDFSKSLTVQV